MSDLRPTEKKFEDHIESHLNQWVMGLPISMTMTETCV